MIRDKDDIHEPPTTLLSVEDTHNFHGGSIIKPLELEKINSFTKKNKLQFHLDGARIFNASVALNQSVIEFTKHVDTVMFCLSKGLSCPVGSIVAGSKEFISKARKFRKMLGGGMRQAGIIASFGLVALEEKWIKRLEEDHKNAKVLAEGLKNLDSLIKVHKPDTNIVIAELLNNVSISKIITGLGREGILAFNISKKKIRFVTHYGIQEDDIQYSIETIRNVFQKY